MSPLRNRAGLLFLGASSPFWESPPGLPLHLPSNAAELHFHPRATNTPFIEGVGGCGLSEMAGMVTREVKVPSVNSEMRLSFIPVIESTSNGLSAGELPPGDTQAFPFRSSPSGSGGHFPTPQTIVPCDRQVPSRPRHGSLPVNSS